MSQDYRETIPCSRPIFYWLRMDDENILLPVVAFRNGEAMVLMTSLYLGREVPTGRVYPISEIHAAAGGRYITLLCADNPHEADMIASIHGDQQ